MTHPRCTHPAFTTPGLTDDEFWALVFAAPDLDVDWEPDEDQIAEFDGYTVNTCMRCGGRIWCETYEEAVEQIEQAVIICLDCEAEIVDMPGVDDEVGSVAMHVVPWTPVYWERMWMFDEYLERTAA